MEPKQIRLLSIALTAISLLPALPVAAQKNPCADPQAPRFGVILTDESKASDSGLEKRRYQAGIQFQGALEKQLTGLCILRDFAVFDDPKSYPALSGSPVFVIRVHPSLKHQNVAVIAVEIKTMHGPYVEDSVSLGAEPLLIESDTDYEDGAKMIMMFYNGVVEALAAKSK